jgi:hypothetical protein
MKVIVKHLFLMNGKYHVKSSTAIIAMVMS